MGAKLSYKGNDRTETRQLLLLYKRTSRRVPGKKYPQPVDTYIGVITPEGVVKSTRKKIDLTGIEVKKYEFPKALRPLCPKGGKEPLGELWKEVF